jgi:hypothetical protein
LNLKATFAFLVFWSYDQINPRSAENPGRIFNLVWAAVHYGAVIAGGSDGVFRIFTKLGIRNPAERLKKPRKYRRRRRKRKTD